MSLKTAPRSEAQEKGRQREICHFLAVFSSFQFLFVVSPDAISAAKFLIEKLFSAKVEVAIYAQAVTVTPLLVVVPVVYISTVWLETQPDIQ
jgi:hypothetical protein